MPKFACKCGNVLNLSAIWDDCEYRLIQMSNLGKVATKLGPSVAPTTDAFIKAVDDAGPAVYKCNVCGRMHVEEEPHKFTPYAREQSPVGGPKKI